jgi:hypothetical protein
MKNSFSCKKTQKREKKRKRRARTKRRERRMSTRRWQKRAKTRMRRKSEEKEDKGEKEERDKEKDKKKGKNNNEKQGKLAKTCGSLPQRNECYPICAHHGSSNAHWVTRRDKRIKIWSSCTATSVIVTRT